MKLGLIQSVIGLGSSVDLPPCLRRSPLTRRSIDGECRPSRFFLVAEVDEQGVGVVLDAKTMARIRLFV